MWPEDLLDFVLEDLIQEIATEAIHLVEPMPCDRWLARSAIQKAIRRGEVEVALQALAALLIQHPAGLWRDLVIIALEDVGVAGMNTIARVVAAARDRKWRRDQGGEWVVASALVKRMAAETHCQATCDLSLKLANDSAMEPARHEALEAEPSELAAIVAYNNIGLDQRAVAVLALAGGLAEEQRFLQPAAVFEALTSTGRSTHVVATAQAAWRICRDDMSLLLPLVWDEWMKEETSLVRDDDFAPATMIAGVPNYAIDQHTRAGQVVIRAYLGRDRDMVTLLGAAGVPPVRRPKVVGDLLFLTEGGCVKRRAIWPEGDRLRQKFRPCVGAFSLGDLLPAAKRLLAAKARQIDELRRQTLQSTKP